MRGLKGKTAIVTGGLGELGYESAKRLVEEGCKVALFDLKNDPQNRASDIGATAWQVDISDESQIQKVVSEVATKLGKPNILVNCAAIFIFKSINASLEDFRTICDANIAGPSLMAKAVVPYMKELAGGSIINFSSVSGFIGQQNLATYNATKFAIRGLTKCWAQDLAPLGIRVNTICPGYIETQAFANYCKQMKVDFDEENMRVSAMHLLNRQGKPHEVAAGVAFLASDDASFMTGSDLLVEGGYLAK